jgi:cell division transport system permease protein
MRFVVSETFQSIRRNVSMIVSVTLVTFISFLFIGASVLLQAQVNRAQAQWYDKVEVVVWLCPDGQSQAATCATGKAPTQAQIASIENTIQSQLSDAVQKTTYVSREDFFRNTFTKQYPGGVYRGRTMTAADMQDSLRLKLKNPQRYQEVSQVLSGRQGVEEVVDQRQIFEPVFRILNSATIVTIVLAAVMILVAILLTGTTIRMSAANRKEETEIERLVGASNWTIRMPFILEGALAALLGSVLAVLALAAIVQVFVTGWLASSVSWINLITTRTVWLISPFLIVGAIVISVISSWVSLRRYLQV